MPGLHFSYYLQYTHRIQYAQWRRTLSGQQLKCPKPLVLEDHFPHLVYFLCQEAQGLVCFIEGSGTMLSKHSYLCFHHSGIGLQTKNRQGIKPPGCPLDTVVLSFKRLPILGLTASVDHTLAGRYGHPHVQRPVHLAGR